METITAELMADGSKRDRRGRRLAGAERRAELLRAYDTSGLTQAAFARQEGIKYPTFASWVQARRSQAGAGGGTAVRTTAQVPPGGGVRFAEMRLPAGRRDEDALSVTLPDGLVVRGAEALAVAALVRALQGRA